MEIRKHIGVAALTAGAIGVLGGCAAQGAAFALGGATSSSHQQGERLARLAEAMGASDTTDGR